MKWIAAMVFPLILAAGLALAQNPAPVINQPLSPDAAAPGGASFTLTVNGGEFVSGATVQWNGQPLATTFVSSAKLTAIIPSSNIAVPATAKVTVTNPGVSVASNVVYFPVGTADPGVYYSDAAGSPFTGAPLAVGDFAGNGEPSVLVLACYQTQLPGCVTLFVDNPDGTFSQGPSTNFPSGFVPLSFVGDFNGDGKLDMVLEDAQTGALTTMTGNSDGTFSQGLVSSVGAGQLILSQYVADLNGDGKLDFIGQQSNAAGEPGPLQVFFGNGDGTFIAGPVTTPPPPSAGEGNWILVGTGDFNNDGKPDLIVEDQTQITIEMGKGDGTFMPATGASSDIGNSSLGTVGVADLNGDGNLDLAIPYGGLAADHSPVTILLGKGDGTFNAVAGCCGLVAPEIITNDIAIGDFNDDGNLDLVLGITNQQSVRQSYYFETLLGNGDGTFTATNWTKLLPTSEVGLWSADYNGDGRLDFMARGGTGGAYILQQGPAQSPPPDFTLAMTNPAVSVTAGGTVTDNVQIADVGGFLGVLSPVTCTGAPAGAVCSVQQPPNELFPTAQGSFVVTVSTQAAPLGSDASPPPTDRWPLLGWFAALAIAAAAGIRAVLQGNGLPVRKILATSSLLLGASLAGGCGPAATKPTGGTPPGTYTLAVNASAGSITHSAQFKVTVQ